MDVRVETEDGCSLPDGCSVAVRVADVQKQTAYDPKKLYRFPEARRCAKIDVFSRFGTCELVWGADEPETKVCEVRNGPSDPAVKLKVSLSRPVALALNAGVELLAPADSRLQSKNVKGREVAAQAKKYLVEHEVETLLTSAMRALLKDMPEDAPSFLCDFIMKNGKPPATREAAAKAAAKREEEEAAKRAAEATAPPIQSPSPAPASPPEPPVPKKPAPAQSTGTPKEETAAATDAPTAQESELGAAASQAPACPEAGDAEKEPGAFRRMPSVGTWHGRLPRRKLAHGVWPLAWQQAPSTATWLQPYPVYWQEGVG